MIDVYIKDRLMTVSEFIDILKFQYFNCNVVYNEEENVINITEGTNRALNRLSRIQDHVHSVPSIHEE